MDKRKNEFLELVNQNTNIIHKVCNIYCYKRDYWEDTYQEIIYNLWKSYPSFRQEAQFSTWMYRVALNTALSINRKEARNPLTGRTENHEKYYSPEDADSIDENIDMLYRAIDTLRKLDKAIVLLWLEKKSYAEISSITGLTESNISVKLVRIKEKLRSTLSNGIELNE